MHDMTSNKVLNRAHESRDVKIVPNIFEEDFVVLALVRHHELVDLHWPMENTPKEYCISVLRFVCDKKDAGHEG
jgi:hypothetical protein